MTLKDPATAQEPNGAAKSPRRDAVGAEIPVTVHASRTNQGFGKNLPAVHEEAKTVIVLQQGAVVRLTAALTPGETVVLTNRMTGADVLCRVGQVKSRPGMQHYVDLEFTQRAPGFWGDAAGASQASIASQPPASTLPLPPSLPITPPAAVVPPPASVPAPPPAAAAPPPPPIRVAPLPTPPPAPVAEAKTVEPSPFSQPMAAPQKAQPTTAARSDTSQPALGLTTAYSSSSSSVARKALVAAAVLVLLAGGAAGGYWFYSQQNAASTPAPPPVAYVPPVPNTVNLAESAGTIEPLPDATTNPAAEGQALESQPDVAIETQPRVRVSATPAVPAAPPPVVAAARTPAPPARRSNVPIEQLQAPKARAAAARENGAEAPPVILGAVGSSDPSVGNALLVAEPVAPAPPPVGSQAPVGGQLRSPQLISSQAPVYPSIARAQRLEGVVELDVLVDESGKVVETKVLSGPALLQSAAETAVRGWRYKPAQLNGKPIAVHEKVSVRFSLQQ